MKYMKLHEDARIDNPAKKDDAGYDIYSMKEVNLFPGQIAIIPTGICIEIPTGFVGVICEKSGLATGGVQILGGIIDSGYRGEIKVILKNNNNILLTIKDKIAQLIIIPCITPRLKEVKKLNNTERGKSGFGSTCR